MDPKLSRPGDMIAALASAVSVTCLPEALLEEENLNPWAWAEDCRLDRYRELGEEVRAKTSCHNKKPEDRWDNWAWASCHQAVAIIVRAAVDKDMAMDRPSALLPYVQHNPGKWAYVGDVESTADELLRPGDILNAVDPRDHTCIYLGSEFARLYHPQTDGIIWEASYTDEHARYPGITDKGKDGPLDMGYMVFRFTGTPDGAMDISAYL